MPRQPAAGRKSASVSLYPRDLAAVQQIVEAIAKPGGPAPSDSDAIRDAIHRHPAVCPSAAAEPVTVPAKPTKTRNPRKET
jgi:hypothetical protein